MADENSAGYERRRGARRKDPKLHRRTRNLRRLIVRGLVGGALIAVLATVAWLWHVSSRVDVADARIMAALTPVMALDDGRLVEWLVEEGDHVAAGQVVARLTGRRLHSELAMAEAELAMQSNRYAEAVAALGRIERLSHVEAADQRARSRLAEARLTAARHGVAWRAAVLSADLDRVGARVAEQRATLERLRHGARIEDVDMARTRLDAANALLALRELEKEQSRKLVDEGVDSEHLLEVHRTQVATQQAAVREAELHLKRLRAGALPEEIEAAEQALAAREAERAGVRADMAELKALEAESSMRETEAAYERERLEKQQALHAMDIEQAHAGVRAAAAAVARARVAVDQSRSDLERLDVSSPVEGLVARIVPTVGAYCRRGDLMLIVSNTQYPRWIEGTISQDDAVSVRAGHGVQVRIPALQRETVRAKVVRVDPHTQALDPGANLDGAPGKGQRVRVRIEPTEPLPERLATGTGVRAVIDTRSRPES